MSGRLRCSAPEKHGVPLISCVGLDLAGEFPTLDARMVTESPRSNVPLAARLDALENLARLHFELQRLRRPAPLQIARLHALLAGLAASPAHLERLRATLSSVLRETTAVGLFAEAGIPNDRGLGSKTIDRIARRVLPRPPDDENLERFVSRVFRAPRDCAWIEVRKRAA